MQHFFVTPEQVSGSTITITGSDINHLKNVLRMGAGDQVLVNDGNNNQYLCQILRYETVENRGRKGSRHGHGQDRQAQDRLGQDDQDQEGQEADLLQVAVLQILEQQEVDTELPSKLYLFQALPKGSKMDTIVQKAVELGAFQILPVVTHRCVTKLDEKRAGRRQERWQEIAKSAAKQAGRGYIPKVTGILDFSDAVFCAGSLDVFLLPYELAEDFAQEPEGRQAAVGALEPVDVMARTKEILSSVKPGQSVGVFIGPEGGFEREEVEQAVQAGAQVISLGKRILRTETAGPALLSVLMFELEGSR